MTSLRSYRDADGKHFIRNGNFIRLDRCGCQIWADPNWNEIALAAAIDNHYRNHCYMKEVQD